MSSFDTPKPVPIPAENADVIQRRISSEDLLDQGVVEAILCFGNDHDMRRLHAALQKHRSDASLEQLYALRPYYQIEEHIKRQNFSGMRERDEACPKADDAEYRMGVYRATIEPQVRDALFSLHEKGYVTYESGFKGPQRQSIRWSEPQAQLEHFSFSEELLSALRSHGAIPEVTTTSVGFKVTRPLEESELRLVWDLLAKAMPVIGPPSITTDLPTAEQFRRKQDGKYGPRLPDSLKVVG